MRVLARVHEGHLRGPVPSCAGLVSDPGVVRFIVPDHGWRARVVEVANQTQRSRSVHTRLVVAKNSPTALRRRPLRSVAGQALHCHPDDQLARIIQEYTRAPCMHDL